MGTNEGSTFNPERDHEREPGPRLHDRGRERDIAPQLRARCAALSVGQRTPHPDCRRAQNHGPAPACVCGHAFDMHALNGACCHRDCSAERVWDPVKAVHVVTLKCHGYRVPDEEPDTEVVDVDDAVPRAISGEP